MIYDDLVNALTNIFEVSDDQTAFLGILPRALDQADGMVFRDLDLLAQRGAGSGICVPNNQNIALPTGCIAVEEMQYYPVGTVLVSGQLPAFSGKPVRRFSLDALQVVGVATIGPPVAYAPFSATQVVVTPSPDLAYPVLFIGTFRPAQCSAANENTYVLTYYGDLYLAACCYFMAGYQKDFGQQSDNPQMALSWKSTYDDLLKSAKMEEGKRRGMGGVG